MLNYTKESNDFIYLRKFHTFLTWFSAESVGVVEALLPYRYQRVKRKDCLFLEHFKIYLKAMRSLYHIPFLRQHICAN